MPKNRKKKYDERKKTKILTDDEEEIKIEEKDNFKTKKKHYESLIETNNDKEVNNILTVSELDYVNSVVKSKTFSYDITKNDDFSFKGNPYPKNIDQESKWKMFIDMIMLFEGCKVDITKVIKLTEESEGKNQNEDDTNNNNKNSPIIEAQEEEEYQIDITIENISSFSLIASNSKDFVDYHPISLNITLEKEDEILQNELEIPKGDIIKLINIFFNYKKKKAVSLV